jgi:pimeloyl-ACP methyl ester carboxylesterase
MRTATLLLLLASATPSFGQTVRIDDVQFQSHGVSLSGSIVFPTHRTAHAAVVFIHGSGKQTRDTGLAERLAKAGIAALVYDKRGAGKSGGEYESQQSVSGKNIALLADDAAAALRHLASHSSAKGIPVGFAGISQAGWIAPLSARKSGLAKFLVLWSGPVCKVSEEDIYSKFTADRESRAVPAYAEALRSRKDKYIWPDFLGRDTDAGEDLKSLSIPGLWLFSDNDGSIPVDLSIERLKVLGKAGHRYDYVLFSGLGHNNIDGTFTTAVDWIQRFASGAMRTVVPRPDVSTSTPSPACFARACMLPSPSPRAAAAASKPGPSSETSSIQAPAGSV